MVPPANPDPEAPTPRGGGDPDQGPDEAREEAPETSLAEVRGLLASRGWEIRAAEPLAGDVGRRRYLRLQVAAVPPAGAGLGNAVLALYPTDLRRACDRFERTSRLLREAGVRVPAILDRDCRRGWMLVEDVGPETLYQRFRELPDPWGQLQPWYRRAAELGARVASLRPGEVAALSPALDGAALEAELDQTWEVFLEPRGLVRSGDPGLALARTLTRLCHRLGEDLVPCHRDFMVRNLVPLAATGRRLAVLDHQDLRLGPRFYDLAALLNDSLFPPTELERAVVGDFAAAAKGPEGLPHAYLRAVVQRTLKAVGTFARHGTHLDLVEPTMARAVERLRRLPEGRELGEGALDALGAAAGAASGAASGAAAGICRPGGDLLD